VTKVRSGGYVFLTWVGDHSPRHVHRGGKLVVKLDIENWQAMKGQSSARIERLVRQLLEEGRI
jgi:hypothetical protein